MNIRRVVTTLAIGMILVLGGCGGGGGSGGSSAGATPPANNWDSMLWDQGNWS